ncbi:GNAT family N-acetyltransferase [Clostridiales Family XIII bacterium ASD5510]|uniref:GNAT family N-acetyltransferase n=1 Tax=Hominibacterium faecale TaxID=2839743 RepID=A0A9J6QRJ5_9FIRM|nr:GNAT family N-acetyltransferase [Hominibacterium faecale]MCU7378690.1 GNAT family N-acetyltransferase [Hominibacterium faecale]
MDYIGQDYGQCLYLYIDLLKYGFENENINVWWQKQDEKTTALVLQYYTGTHVFSRQGKYDAAEIAFLLKEIDPSMICGMKMTLSQLEPFFENYELELGLVGKLTNLKTYHTQGCYKANEEEIRELAQVLSEDEALGKPYGFELLYKQLLERYREGFGRNYINRDEGRIVATASTYAEQRGVAVISGVFVEPKFRGKGLSKNVLSAICADLIEEGIEVFSYYYIESATRMHQAVGFEPIGDWAKLVRI